MNKLAILSMLLGSLGTTAMLSDIETRQVNNLYQNKIFEMNFNSNEIKNTVTNKTYSTIKGTGELVNSIKGKGFQTNSDLIRIPASDLNIPTSTEYVTVSAQFKNGGTDTEQMIFAFGLYDIWFHNGWVGFNTAQSDMYGVPVNLPTTEYVTITAVFHKTDITKCKLYLNGVKQNLSYRDSYVAKERITPFQQDFYISSWEQYSNDHYLADGNNIIDEVMIFKGDVTDSEAEKLAMAHRIPELSVRQEGLYAQANWATEILESDLIYNYDFESGSYIPQLTWSSNIVGDNTGGQKVSIGTAYSGIQSLYSPRTYGGMGNWYGFPSTRSDSNIMMFSRQYFKNETKLSMSIRVKDGLGVTNRIGATGDGGWGDSLSKLGAIIAEDTPAGSRTLKVTSLTGLGVGTYITSDRTVKYGAEYCRQIKSITTNIDGTYTLNMSDAFVFAQKKGENVYIRPWRGAYSFGTVTHSNSDWTLYNLNTSVNSYSDYDVATRGGSFYLHHYNQGDTYVDDLKFGYATQVKLYRDDNLVYEGYESQLTDKNATDKSIPVMTDVTINSVYESSNRKITMSFPTVKDTGTTYNYSIKSVGNSGKETFLTQDTPITVISGLKGYSYIIDKNPTTVPSNTVNLTASETSINHIISSSDTAKYYLHIKPIDNQGNVGQTKHILIDNPILTAKSNATSNNIRLDWTMDDIKNKIFKVYQKKPGSSEFQSISATNFEDLKQIRVLNIYPSVAGSETFKTWDGETVTLPPSARLKRWMEEPNAENPKGFGMGIIEVIPVCLSDFNANPDKYLKDSSGNYTIDVIYEGAWDGHGSQDLTLLGLNAITEFIDTGRGYLIGHDTMWSTMTNRRKLADRAGVIPNYIGNLGHTSQVGNTKVEIVKKGALMNYPWSLGEIGDVLNIPFSHTTDQFGYADNWFSYVIDETMRYASPSWTTGIPPDKYIFREVDGKTGSNLFYLMTYNNFGVIQTGHSNGSATEDEQKILANTLFYLNQLSSDNFLTDNSGQDVTAPNKPVISGHTFTEDGYINLSFNVVQDNGSTYSYYVQSEDKNGSPITLSNTVTETITSGLKGYSYIVDSNPSTIPDNTIEQSTNETIKIKTNNSGELYVHIKAIDNVGNTSETYHYRITDITKPTLNLTLAPSSWTNGSATINAIASDIESGLKYIVLPNGNKVSSTTASYTVDKNGVYYFKAVDYMGNETVSSIKVTNIDKNKPTVTITNNQNWTNQNVQVNINATDN